MHGEGKHAMGKCIAVTGPESTGKSRLSFELAHAFKAVYVEEFARKFIAELNRPYTVQDVELIAAKQFQYNLNACHQSEMVVADTEMLVCYIWTKFVFGEVPESINQLMERQYFDLYLLCDIDLPWEFDPLREHPHARALLFDMYEAELIKRKWPYRIVSGKDKQRFDNAQLIVNHLLHEQG